MGSVKTNVGHLDAAAGVAGFIKTILALENRQLPPSLNFSKPNPLIDLERSPFYVNTGLRDWEGNGQPRRAGVTSLGIGGTNAHAILEEAPGVGPSGPSRPWQLLTLSAKTPTALDSIGRDLAEHLEENSPALADVAFTTHLGRKAFRFRRAIVCADSIGAAETHRPGRLEENRLRFVFRERAARDFSLHRPGRAIRFGGTRPLRIRTRVQIDCRFLRGVSRAVHRHRLAEGSVPVRRRSRRRRRVAQPDASHSTSTVCTSNTRWRNCGPRGASNRRR